MYHAATRLPHLLPPAAYYEPETAARELDTAFRGAWRFVGTLDEVANPGDYLARRLSGEAVVIRNFDGKVRALSNVCLHRHCLIAAEPRGSMRKFRCPYHGWEYKSDGRTGRIPLAQNFKPLDDRPKLKAYRVAFCGKLIFVALDDDAPPLEAFLGDLFPLCAARFGSEGRLALGAEAEAPANWKVPVENALESYHVPQVHAATFKEDPGEDRSEHRLEAGWSDFTTLLPFSVDIRLDALFMRFERALFAACGEGSTAVYRHVHVFPNLLFSFTDTVALIQTFEPLGPTRSWNIARQYGLCREAWPGWKRGPAAAWNRFSGEITRRILKEDQAIYSRLQQGLEASRQPGMLGRCEERIHHFQRWLLERQGLLPELEPARVVGG